MLPSVKSDAKLGKGQTMKQNLLTGMLAALLLIFPGPLGARSDEPTLWETFDNWQVYLSTTAAGAFDLCLATRTYDSGEMLVFYADGETSALGLFVEDWKLDAREKYPVHLQFDSGPLIATVAVADETRKSVLFDLNLNEHIGSLIHSSKMMLHTGAGALTYDLAGAEEAIKSAAICTINNAPPGTIDQRQ